MSGYRLTLFGGFALQGDRDAPVTVRSKKSRCLLAYLVLAGALFRIQPPWPKSIRCLYRH